MKKLLMIVCFFNILSTCSDNLSAQERHLRVGLDLTSALKGWSEFLIGYSFFARWSMEASAGYEFGHLFKKERYEYMTHHQEFNDNGYIIPESEGMHRWKLWFSYWPKKTYEGLSISLGIEYMEGLGTDGFCGFGWTLPIYKGLATGISCNIRLLKAWSPDMSENGEICVNLSYRF